jgi:hypothetical protein
MEGGSIHVLVVAGAAGTAVEVLGVAVVAVEGADVLLELPLLKTVPSLFIYFPMLFLRSAGPSDAPGADELMLMVVVEVLGYPGMWCWLCIPRPPKKGNQLQENIARSIYIRTGCVGSPMLCDCLVENNPGRPDR